MKSKISNNIYSNTTSTGEALDIYVMEQIGEDWWTGEGVTKQSILNEIKGRKIANISLHISSPGGDVDHALAIKDMLLDTGAHIEAHLTGLPASAATIVMACAHKITMSADSLGLIHLAATGTYGNKAAHEKAIATLDKVDNVIAGLFAKKSGKDASLFISEMQKDEWKTPQELKDLGIVDEIVDKTPITNSMRHVYENAIKNNGFKVPKGFTFDNKPQNNNDMTDKTATTMFDKFLNILEKAGLGISASKKDVKVTPQLTKNLVKDFKASVETLLNEEAATVTNAADYSATVSEAVNSIELEDGTTLDLPNTPYEVSADGATALQTDIEAAVTATGVTVSFDEAEASLTIAVSGTEQVLATVNGSVAFETEADGGDGGEQTTNSLKKEIENLKKQKAATQNTATNKEVENLQKERDKLRAELKNLKGGKSGGATGGKGFEKDKPEEKTNGENFVTNLFKAHQKSK